MDFSPFACAEDVAAAASFSRKVRPCQTTQPVSFEWPAKSHPWLLVLLGRRDASFAASPSGTKSTDTESPLSA